jgi:class 3 adenylate cyclase/pimeloyl-ACP methyl ester carboxylesterase
MLKTRYAHSGDLHIAYQVIGDGPIDVVYIPGWFSHVEAGWDVPPLARFYERLASFSRLIIMDKRGTGASDRNVTSLSVDDQMDDVHAVMEAAGSTSAALFGAQEGASIAILHAATYPERTRALITFSTRARFMVAPDYPWGLSQAEVDDVIELVERAWEDPVANAAYAASVNPSLKYDTDLRDQLMRHARFSASPSTTTDMLRMYTSIDLRPVLPTVGVPTLVLNRAKDPFNPPIHGQFIADHIPGAAYVEIPGSDPFIPAGKLDVIVDEIQEFLTGAREAVATDRVLATVLYTDFVDSTRQSAELGDRAWSDLLNRHDALVRRQLDQFRGRWVRHRGDGVLAAFDGPARAIRCASTIRDEASQMGLEIRSGLHTGEVERRGNDLSGIAMSIGARVMETATGGEILVSQTVKDLVAGSGIRFADRGSYELKGLPDEWHLYAVA